MKRIEDFGESLVDVFLISWACLTSFWFWFPVVFTAYMYFQLWAIFFVHPLTILMVPVFVSVVSVVFEKKRVEAQYGLDKVKLLKASDPLGAGPAWKKVRWDVEKAIMEYQKSLKKADNERTKHDT